jgi:hypothetical protein
VHKTDLTALQGKEEKSEPIKSKDLIGMHVNLLMLEL